MDRRGTAYKPVVLGQRTTQARKTRACETQRSGGRRNEMCNTDDQHAHARPNDLSVQILRYKIKWCSVGLFHSGR